MKILKILLPLLLQVWKVSSSRNDTCFQLDVYPDKNVLGHDAFNFCSLNHTYGQLPCPISLGQHSFYEHFISTSNQNSAKKLRHKHYVSCSHVKWLNTALMLCGDIHPCPGPGAGSLYTNFKKRGMHFIHLNVRSLLPKIDQICLIAKETNPACLIISETWLDNSVFDSEITIPNYVVCRNDRNRHGGGVCVYVR